MSSSVENGCFYDCAPGFECLRAKIHSNGATNIFREGSIYKSHHQGCLTSIYIKSILLALPTMIYLSSMSKLFFIYINYIWIGQYYHSYGLCLQLKSYITIQLTGMSWLVYDVSFIKGLCPSYYPVILTTAISSSFRLYL